MVGLTERQLRTEAGEQSFARGEGYVPYVRGMRVVGQRAHGTIQARNVYLVELGWSAGLDGSCTCPHYADGNFCKHLVALGLTVIDGGYAGSEPDPAAPGHELDPMLRKLESDELRALILGLAARHADVLHELQLRATVMAGDPQALADELLARTKDVLSTRGHVDYRRSFDVARDAEELLDELEIQLDSGAADAAQPALLRAVTRLRQIVLRGDDSSGLMGSACQRAAELYARACREGKPDPTKLAKWFVKFRADSPGWPRLELADVVDAFDDAALAAYRRAVARLDERQRGDDHWHRFEVDQMLLELADHDGDVDRAVELLTQREHPEYGAIVDRLRRVGRDEEAVAWMDRAVREGRVSRRGGGNEFWLSPGDVAGTYRELGRIADAIEVLRNAFAREPGTASFRQLVDFAEDAGRGAIERDWAFGRARELASDRFGNGAPLIEIALAEGDLDTAWSAAREFGAGHLWQPLAQASASSRPVDAAELYRPHIEADLDPADSKVYPIIAERLATMRDLYAKGDASDRFAAYVGEIRTTYARRPALMSALDRAGL